VIGTTLSHFTITAKLGKGGMGEVFQAQDTKLGRDVAIKVLPAEVADDPQRLERFEREAKAVAALNHPNIVTVYSVEEADGVHFMAMELVKGETLTRRIPEDGMPLEEFWNVAIRTRQAGRGRAAGRQLDSHGDP
jgi:serine/threonine protein kinase